MMFWLLADVMLVASTSKKMHMREERGKKKTKWRGGEERNKRRYNIAKGLFCHERNYTTVLYHLIGIKF